MSETLPAALWWSVYISGLALWAVLLCNLGCSWEMILNYFTDASPPPTPSIPACLSLSGTSRMLVLPKLSFYFPLLSFISLFFPSVPRDFPQLYLWLLLSFFYFCCPVFYFPELFFGTWISALWRQDLSSILITLAPPVPGSLSVPEQAYSLRALWIS